MNFAAFLNLTKPKIVLSFVLTGAAAMVVEGSLLNKPLEFFLILIAIAFTGGGANAFNQYLERDIDARMKRTAKKRPLPQGLISPRAALIFSILLCALAVIYLAGRANLASAFLALATILFYSFFYTLWLKPRTPYNIVIGGAAGATAPLIGWAAATGGVSWIAFWMFSLVFFWTPPHFWALALNMKEQYAEVGMPMLPVAKGDAHTREEIWWYSLLMVPLTYIPLGFHWFGKTYSLGVTLLNIFWLFSAWRVKTKKDAKTAYAFFGYSILYLMLLFILMMV